jgi:hypothetical protein
MSYVRQQAIIDDMNYYNDSRTRAAQRGDWYKSFSEESMTAVVEFTHWGEDDEEIVESVTFPVRFEVCDLCNGKGSHVNPSIDCGGLGQDDWDRDPDLEEGYHSGRYDVSCNQCHGKRVVPVINDGYLNDEQERALKIIHDLAEDEADFHAECMAERRMGC